MDTNLNDVQVRVNIIEARNLSGKDSNGMSDPVVFVETNGQKKHTSIIPKTSAPFWDQTFIFNQRQTTDEFLKSKIKISVFDANTILRNELIGSKELDYQFLYKLKGHEIYRCWVALVDDTDKVEGVQGYLKLSIVVLKGNDEALAHDEDVDEDENVSDVNLQDMLLLPPGIQTQDYEVSLKFFKGEKFPKMDTVGHCDPFFRVSFGGVKKDTKIRNGENASFNEEIIIPITEPSMTDLIKIELFDEDKLSKNDLISTHYFSYEEIKKLAFSNRWLNLYGPSHPDNIIAKLDNGQLIAKEMAEGNIDPDMWVGRVMMDVSVTQVKEASLRSHELRFSSPDPETESYTLRLDLFSATDIFGDKIFCKIKLGPHEIKTDDRKAEGREVSFFQNVEQNFTLPKNPEDLPYLYIMLYKHKGLGTSRIGWVKLSLRDELLNKEPSDLWKSIQTNYFGDHAKEQAGFIHFKLQFKQESIMRNIPMIPLVKPELVKYNLRARIYQARDLASADQNGSSDPYCIIRCGGAKAKTKTIMDNLFPVWNEEISMVVNLPKDLKYAPMIQITVMDFDSMAIDDMIGKSSIPVGKFGEQPSEPTWYTVYDRNPNQKEGEILASFQLIPFEKSKNIPSSTNINPKLIKSQIEFGLISGKGFSYTSIGKNKASQIELYTTNKKESQKSIVGKGLHPVYLDTVKMPAMIPQDPLFSSYVHMGVLDSNKKINPVIGTGNISLFSYIPWNKNAEKAKKELLLESLPPPVDKIPGATEELLQEQIKIESEEKKVEIVLDLKVPDIVIDIPPEVTDKITEKTPLLFQENNQEENNKKSLKIKLPLGERKIGDLPATEIEGFKEEDIKEEKKIERPSVQHELERDLDEVPFIDIPIYRGKKKGLTLWDKLKRNKDGNTFNQVGTIKAHINVKDLEGGKNEEDTLDIKKAFSDDRYVCRVYVLAAEHLVTTDLKHFSTYLKINTEGDDKAHSVTDLTNIVERNINPEFYKCYQLDCSFPSHSILTVQLWDQNKVVKDELIGETKIDLTSRFFSKEWKEMGMKPIERRSLWNPASRNPQGLVKMWVEILTPQEANDIPILDIAPPKPEEYELRVIVWDMKDVAFRDDLPLVGKMSDVYVSIQPEGHKPLTTDIHWRSDGNANFNWRMIWNVPLPNHENFHRLRIQAWDKDIIDPNDAICEAVLNLKGFFKKCLKEKLTYPNNQIDKQWVAMGHPNYPNVQGRILLTVQLFNKEDTISHQAGIKRDEPNQHPFLPPPNRPALSSSFFGGLGVRAMQMFGKFKCCCIIVGCLIIGFAVLMIVLKVAKIF